MILDFIFRLGPTYQWTYQVYPRTGPHTILVAIYIKEELLYLFLHSSSAQRTNEQTNNSILFYCAKLSYTYVEVSYKTSEHEQWAGRANFETERNGKGPRPIILYNLTPELYLRKCSRDWLLNLPTEWNSTKDFAEVLINTGRRVKVQMYTSHDAGWWISCFMLFVLGILFVLFVRRRVNYSYKIITPKRNALDKIK